MTNNAARFKVAGSPGVWVFPSLLNLSQVMSSSIFTAPINIKSSLITRYMQCRSRPYPGIKQQQQQKNQFGYLFHLVYQIQVQRIKPLSGKASRQ